MSHLKTQASRNTLSTVNELHHEDFRTTWTQSRGFQRSLPSFLQYINYVIKTWFRVLLSFPYTLWSDPLGAISLVAFAVVSTIVLFFVLLFTYVLRFPPTLWVLKLIYGQEPDVGFANIRKPSSAARTHRSPSDLDLQSTLPSSRRSLVKLLLPPSTDFKLTLLQQRSRLRSTWTSPSFFCSARAWSTSVANSEFIRHSELVVALHLARQTATKKVSRPYRNSTRPTASLSRRLQRNSTCNTW